MHVKIFFIREDPKLMCIRVNRKKQGLKNIRIDCRFFISSYGNFGIFVLLKNRTEFSIIILQHRFLSIYRCTNDPHCFIKALIR